jgi:hypothetical protein
VENYHYFGINQFKNYVINNKEKEDAISELVNSLLTAEII